MNQTFLNPKLDSISLALKGRKLLHFIYEDQAGAKTRRKVEPYEIKEQFLFAWDKDKKSVRSFRLQGISKVEVLAEGFTPRFPVKTL